MRKASQEPSYDNYIEQKLQGAFGYSDDQLLAEFEQAEAQPEDPDLLPPKDEWRKLLERVDDAEKKKLEEHKVLRLKRIAKPLILVAVLGAILVGTGIGASGKRGFEYLASGKGNGNFTWDNNEDNLVRVEAEDEAYQRIEDELGIDVIKLGYMPAGMKFQEIKIFENEAIMSFVYNDERFNVVQTLYDKENASNTAVHSENYRTVVNNWIKEEILIERNILNDTEIEYGARFKNDKAYYYLTGILEEEEFAKIVEKIKYKN